VLIDGEQGGNQWREIIGIVGNVKGWPLEAGDDLEIYESFPLHGPQQKWP
jgi:hypothetical protein